VGEGRPVTAAAPAPDPEGPRPVLGFRVGVFNWRLRRARERAGLTMAQLAAAVGCSPSTLYRVCGLRERPGEALADRLAAALGAPVDELFPDLIDGLVARRGTVEVPLDAAAVRALADDSAGAVVRRQALREAARRLLPELAPRERAVIEWRMGFRTGHQETYETVAQRMGIGTKERVRQLEASGLARLRRVAGRTGALEALDERP
jgi:transcriptional regulator with XRE-family HTH domain